MKLLIVGIDGGTVEIFDAFDMPFWHSLRRQGVLLPIKEDLNQRGWARMLSGQGAEETGGLYTRPKLDGTRDFTLSFGYEQMSEATGFRPIWSFAERTGGRVGIMNVPTTSPAQKVDGFYVSGGGGGIFQGGLPDNAVFPHEIKSDLESTGYIFDTRLGAQRFDSIDVLCTHLKDMMLARQASFSLLARKYVIDFGFLAFRAPTVILYLAMSEIAHTIHHARDSTNARSCSPPWGPLLTEHFRALDRCLERLFNELTPEHHMIVSDHSIVPWTHEVDFNGFLVEYGYGRYHSSIGRFLRNAAKAALWKTFRSRILGAPVRQCLSTLWTAGANMSGGSRAFSGTSVYGIYINDDDRFGGPVSVDCVDDEVRRIVSDFNWKAEQSRLGLRAEPYREKFRDSRCERLLPDITVLQSGHAFPAGTGSDWYRKNPRFGPVESLAGVGGMHTGQKGVEPIVLANTELAGLIDNNEIIDLRQVHTLTRKLFVDETN